MSMIVVTISVGLVLNIGKLLSLNIRSMENKGIGGLRVSSTFNCSSVKKWLLTVLESTMLTDLGKNANTESTNF
jgi:hypothetical protein